MSRRFPAAPVIAAVLLRTTRSTVFGSRYPQRPARLAPQRCCSRLPMKPGTTRPHRQPPTWVSSATTSAVSGAVHMGTTSTTGIRSGRFPSVSQSLKSPTRSLTAAIGNFPGVGGQHRVGRESHNRSKSCLLARFDGLNHQVILIKRGWGRLPRPAIRQHRPPRRPPPLRRGEHLSVGIGDGDPGRRASTPAMRQPINGTHDGGTGEPCEVGMHARRPDTSPGPV